eukprot:Gb_19869 [translate_table: standard]
MILDDRFWVDVKFIVDVIELVVDVIRYGDIDSPCLGEVYETLDSMCERMQTIDDTKDKELYKTLEEKIHQSLLNLFESQEFGTIEAKNDLSMNDPIDWWTLHGTKSKELQAFATHVLSQVASSSNCERN